MNRTFWPYKTVMVTGGSGFIGGWVVRTLASLNADVHILDMQPPLGLSEVQHTFHELDLRDHHATVRMLREYGAEILIHLAGQADVAVCQQDPMAAFEKNVVCTYTLLEACRTYENLKSIVVVSSNHVYGTQKQMPSPEDAPLNGAGIYAASKLCADMIARAYGKSYGLPVAIARITNSFGGDDPHVTHIITGSIISALKREAPVIRQSGRDSKGYLYVEDTVNGLLTLAEQTALRAELHGEAFNFAPDRPIRTKDLVREIVSIVGEGVEPEILDPLADYEEEHLDNKKAQSVLGWSPQYSLSVAVAKTVASLRERYGEGPSGPPATTGN